MKAEIRQDNLPPEWSVADLGDLLERITNGLICQQEKEPPGIPVTRIETISNGVVDLGRIRYVRELDESKKEKFLLQRGDVLFSHINSDLHLGKTAVVTNDKPLLHGMNLLLLRTKKEQLDPYYLHYLLNFYRRSGTFMAIAQHAVNQSSLNQKKINSIKVPLAPLDQQKRIVAEIEKQFSRLDKAVANLKRVKANLKRYKAAVLKAAVEGRLVETEAERARREGRSFETGEQLLQRILETRRSQWQGKGIYKEPAAPDNTDLPELPEGWVWANCGAVLSGIEAGASFKCVERPPANDEIGVLKVSAVSWGTFNELESKTCTDPDRVEEGYIVRQGDFLFSRANTIDLVGASVIVHQISKRLMLSDKTLRFKISSQASEDWLLTCLRSKFGRDEIERLATGNQESMRNIGQDRIRQIRIPLPPIAEQHRIVTEVDRRLSLLHKTEAQADANLQRAERLRQSILSRAFSGELLSKDVLRERVV